LIGLSVLPLQVTDLQSPNYIVAATDMCAQIHRFTPDLICYSRPQGPNVKINFRSTMVAQIITAEHRDF